MMIILGGVIIFVDSDQLLHTLHQSVRRISSGLNDILEPYGIYSSEWSIIHALYHKKDLSQKDLACYLCIEPAAISKTVAKLEGKGYISRKTGSDKREKIVCLTPSAFTAYPTWQKIVSQHRASLLKNIPEAEQQLLLTLLTKIYQNADHTSIFKGDTTSYANNLKRTTLDEKL
ncbi:MarR family winged helix-turn-helix transcriptional regulator [Anaerosinus massiliensis]|uniref:MarR family winged helix-turn-helix transcriptional regulator n=1 Tax=Massilibacillus massiliensis TaxID=1806837 RepID=UPI0018FE0677|nr:MarR family transcriptional regulator [Massilibacillus massiliensis]